MDSLDFFDLWEERRNAGGDVEKGRGDKMEINISIEPEGDLTGDEV